MITSGTASGRTSSATGALWRRAPAWRWSLILGVLSAAAFVALVPVPKPAPQPPSGQTAIEAGYISPIPPAVRTMLNNRIAETAAAREAAALAKAEAAALAAEKSKAEAAAQAAERRRIEAETAAREQARQQRAEAAKPPAPPPAPVVAPPPATNPVAGLVAPNAALPTSAPPLDRRNDPSTIYSIVNGTNDAAGMLTAANRLIPLPSGPFERIASVQGPLGSTVQHSAAFAQFRPGMLAALVIINVSPRAEKTGAGLRAYASCNRRDFHYLTTVANEDFGAQECRYVNHVWPTAWSSNEAGELFRSIVTALTTRQVPVPNAMLTSSFHFANQNEVTRVFYYFNPEVRGIQSARTTGWAESDWHKNYLARDARRIDYVGELEKWTNDWLPFVRTAFTGEKAAVPPARLARQFVSR